MSEEELLRAYYQAKKCCNAEFSGDLRGDWVKLSEEVNEYSLRRFGQPFDFGDDEEIYNPTWLDEE